MSKEAEEEGLSKTFKRLRSEDLREPSFVTSLYRLPLPPQKKLYIITRADLSPGLRAAQSCHALALFQEVHPVVYSSWYKTSNNLVVLEVEDRAALLGLVNGMAESELLIAASCFYEPDLDDELTAIACSYQAKPFISGLRLALRDVA